MNSQTDTATPISSCTNYHHVQTISAHRHNYPNAPLQISLRGGSTHEIPSDITVFLDDDVLTERLVAAINEVCKARREELQAAPAEAA
jgi:hypothetical protein